jgi:ubiquitin C-terminal hydrolase
VGKPATHSSGCPGTVTDSSRANSGHYTAFVKSDNEWWSLNDERAAKVETETVLKAKAYLLFYQQSDNLG